MKIIRYIFKLIASFFHLIYSLFYKLYRKNKLAFIILCALIFFAIYIGAFSAVRNHIEKSKTTDVLNVDTGNEKNKVEKQIEIKNKEEAKKSLSILLSQSKKVYIADEDVENIKITGSILDNFDRHLEMFVKIRSIDDTFNAKYHGYSEDGIKFQTDFNYMKIIKGSRVEVYKIPVAMKDDFENLYRRMIYTSVDFITSKKGLGKIEVYHKNDKKRIMPWNKDDLVYKILYKREVGKIQPEKEFSETKDNYTIKMEKSGVDLTIQTMGKDFIKVICGDNTAYYEVYPDLYNYMHDDVFN
ncbi:hypothetical protein [Peptostreptococcus equinus]|uniref:Uncharacterized protein n=1 Tax=Peptostreptococcus equinus TaxID=3003601 RepID=A0ABY7JPE0_9FIRM|nr:hypothetical protein [Peptostreptococcus sp. CBA3647]WAW15034.1 hypothetical protein O0R46_00895 [Peptostreptococcus sp. CBA3647]